MSSNTNGSHIYSAIYVHPNKCLRICSTRQEMFCVCSSQRNSVRPTKKGDGSPKENKEGVKEIITII